MSGKNEILKFGDDYRGVDVSPERGGIITSIRLLKPGAGSGTEILYLDQDSFSGSGNVRGGIPIMFPLAGNLNGINPNPYPQLPQHGVARSTPAWKMISSERGSNWSFLEVLDSRDMAACLRNAYPFSFGVKLEAVAKELDGITIALEAHNNGPADMPVAMGLHPYHPCPADRKHEIRFRFSGGEIIEAAVQSWTNGGTIAVPNPRTSLIIEIPELGTLEVTIGETFQQIWVWSLPNRPFFCLEFAMRGEGGLVDDPHLVSAGDTVTGTVAYRLLA